MASITGAAVVEEAKRLAMEYPYNVYLPGQRGDTCQYRSGECSNGSTGCLFGQVFKNLGVTDERLAECEINSHGAIASAVQVCKNLDIVLSDEELDYVSHMQSRQDDGVPWGEADRMATEYAARMAAKRNKGGL